MSRLFQEDKFMDQRNSKMIVKNHHIQVQQVLIDSVNK